MPHRNVVGEDGRPLMSILDMARAKGAKPDEKGCYNGAELYRVGFDILGGCQHCQATISASNGYPSRTGYWLCADCIGDSTLGFTTLEEFDAWESERIWRAKKDYDDQSAPDEDRCSESPLGRHIPDWSTVSATYDGGEAYVDVNCMYCGRSGCAGTNTTLSKSIQW